jgi:archaellum component FlaC
LDKRAVDAHASRKPSEVFGDDLRTTRGSLNQLKDRVSGLTPSPVLDQIRTRLSDLARQFQKVGTAIEGMSGTASSKQLLKLQADMYQINENLSVVTKMVDQVTSGVKTLLQTQV